MTKSFTDKLDDGVVLAAALVLVLFVAGYLLWQAFGPFASLNARCEQSNGVLIWSHSGRVCIRRDAVIRLE